MPAVTGRYSRGCVSRYHSSVPKPESAGILLWRLTGARLEVMLVHPGGPFWARKDEGAWSIPKGEIPEGEEPVATAAREFVEETGCALQGDLVALGSVKQKSGKVVHAWALRGDFDVATLRSNTFEMEWPPRSRKMQSFPEVDRAEWFEVDAARRKINPAQEAFLDRLERLTSSDRSGRG